MPKAPPLLPVVPGVVAVPPVVVVPPIPVDDPKPPLALEVPVDDPNPLLDEPGSVPPMGELDEPLLPKADPVEPNELPLLPKDDPEEPRDELPLLPNEDPVEPRDELPPPNEDPEEPREEPFPPSEEEEDPNPLVDPLPMPVLAPVWVIPVCCTVAPNKPRAGTFCSPSWIMRQSSFPVIGSR